MKGHGIIHRFSEDIDIRIEPPPELHVKTGRNHSKQAHAESRRNFFDWPAKTIRIALKSGRRVPRGIIGSRLLP